MPITTYTSYDQIRAALGVTADEIEDATLALDLYAYNLTSELEDIDASLASAYATVAALTSRTDPEERLYQAIRLFATYAVAIHLTTALPLFSPKDITDGKAALSRYADSPYKPVINEVKGLYEKFRGRLEKAYAAYTATSAPSASPRSYFSVVSPASDPVLGL